MVDSLIGFGRNTAVPERATDTQQTRQLQQNQPVDNRSSTSSNTSNTNQVQESREAREARRVQEDLQSVFSGVSLGQTAEQGLGDISNDIERIRELAEQANDESLTDDERVEIQESITDLQDNIRNTIDDTSFAGRNLLSEDGSINFQVNSNNGESEDVATRDTTSNLSDVLNIDVTTEQGREDALAATDDAQDFLNDFQDDINASLSRFDEASRGLSSLQNLTAESDESTNPGSERLADVQNSLASIGGGQPTSPEQGILASLQNNVSAEDSESVGSQILLDANRATQLQANQSAQIASQLLG